MHFLSPEIETVLIPFATLFSNTVWLNTQVLIIGSVLCTGKRTVTSALRVMGLSDEKKFTNYHRVLNRAKWNSLCAAKILLPLLIVMVAPCLPIVIAIDETVERRKGKKIGAKGCYRDAVRSTQNKVIHCFGLKWISMQLIVSVP
ncbi:transposase, partial [Desulfococcaceae bacterium HSG9]|nr:transposase [Desulfococcaceae bacterium HSG9]